jgi:8-amino-7-oxononanoate synthase
MSKISSKPVLSSDAKSTLIQRVLGRKQESVSSILEKQSARVQDNFLEFERHPAYESIVLARSAAAHFGVADPYFKVHQGVASANTQIDGRDYINFSSFNYLGLAGHPKVNQAAKDAIDRYGTSASASRLVSGERPIHRELEQGLANIYLVDDAIVFSSGHATNVSVIATLLGSKDLILHDSLAHNSIIKGAELSGATRRSFPHNDLHKLSQILHEIRHRFERVIIVVEGHYSMDGDIADLPELIKIKHQYGCWLMVDEAHSLGVLGNCGLGLHEHYQIDGKEVDIWMGSLSKTLASGGGYIAGSAALIDLLKCASPSFVYSTGLPPSNAAAALAALELMQEEPSRVEKLQERSRLFFNGLQKAGYNTGRSIGASIVPIVTGSSLKATKLSHALFNEGVNVPPIIYPAVEEKVARVRFFISSMHTTQHINQTLQSLLRVI